MRLQGMFLIYTGDIAVMLPQCPSQLGIGTPEATHCLCRHWAPNSW